MEVIAALGSLAGVISGFFPNASLSQQQDIANKNLGIANDQLKLAQMQIEAQKRHDLMLAGQNARSQQFALTALIIALGGGAGLLIIAKGLQ